MLDRLFLHIGTVKTGTTTLQLAMELNRDLLRRHGFLYPIVPEYGHVGLALYAANEKRMFRERSRWGLSDEARYATFVDEWPSRLGDTLLADRDIHTAILSCEGLSTGLRSVEEIARVYRLLVPFARELRVIVYLRRQDEVAVSWYTAMMKAGRTDEFGTQWRYWYDYLTMLDMWAEVFGVQNLIVRVFEPAQLHREGLLADFATAIGFEPYEQLHRPPDQNASLDVHVLEFLRRFNAFVPPVMDGRANPSRSSLGEAIAALPTQTRLAPSTEAAAALLDQCAASNAAVARKYLGRPDGVLFTAAPPGDRPERLPSLDIDKAIEIAAKLWQWQEMRFQQRGTDGSQMGQ